MRPMVRLPPPGRIFTSVPVPGSSFSMTLRVSGGVAFATPEEAVDQPLADEATVFELHDDADRAWLRWSPAIPLGDEPSPAMDDAPVGQ